MRPWWPQSRRSPVRRGRLRSAARPGARADTSACEQRDTGRPATSKLVKERKELHKILERELWIFGDEYTLLASDRGLDEVLARHLATLRPAVSGKGRKAGAGLRRSDGSRGIVDLMLSQQRRGVDRREHLVVELKRPSVRITQTEVAQLKSYADVVAGDPQFHGINVHWDLWVISSELDSTVTRDANQPNSPPGQITTWDNVRIWAKSWSQIVNECETRLRHFKDALEYDASKEHAADSWLTVTAVLAAQQRGNRHPAVPPLHQPTP